MVITFSEVLLTIFIAAVVLFIVWLVLKIGSNPSAKKIGNTLNTKLNKLLKDLSKKGRTPELIIEEITQLLDAYKKEKKEEFQDVMNELIIHAKNLRNSIYTIKTQIEDYTKEVNHYKIVYNRDKKESDKELALKYIQFINTQKQVLTKLENNLKTIELNKAKLNEKISMFNANVEIKKATVLGMITEYSYNKSFDINTNINFNDLLQEFDLAVEIEEAKKNIDEKLNNIPKEEEESVSEDVIKQFEEWK